MDKKKRKKNILTKNRVLGEQAGRKTNIKSRRAVFKLLLKMSQFFSSPSDINLMFFDALV